MRLERKNPLESMFSGPKIDLTLVCGARPELIARTLESFSEKVFKNFNVVHVFANIDQFQGGVSEVAQVRSIVESYFPHAIVRTPSQPSFTNAVKWLWGQVQSDHCLHLEDDWLADAEILSNMVMPAFVGNVAQVSIGTLNKHWRHRYPFHCRTEHRRFLGIRFGSRLLKDEPIFTTSPSFITREFAQTCARLMDPQLDPEKQLYNNANIPLREYTRTLRNMILGRGPNYLIRDIGRDYRGKHNLKKVFINGQSHWLVEDDVSKEGVK